MFIRIKKSNIINKLIYLTIISGFFGVAFFSIPFGSITLFFYRILIMALLIFVSLIFLKNKKIYISHIKVKNYLYFLFIWFVYAIFSLGWAKTKIEAVREIVFLVFGFSIVFLVVYFFRKLHNYKWLYKIWILVLVFMIILGFWEVITGNHLAGSKLNTSSKYIPTGVFYNQNNFATYLALSIPFLLSLIKYKDSYKKIIGIILLFSTLYLIILTGSRANYLAVILGIIIWFLFNLNIKNKVKYIFITIAIGIIFSSFFPEQFINILNEIKFQISSIFTNYFKFSTGERLGSIGVRINLIKNSLNLLIESFGFGVGAGNVEYYLKANIHNWWFEILTNYGIFIFAGYVLFYLGIIKELFKINKVFKKNSFELMISDTLLTAMVMFFLASISPSSILAFKPQWLLFAFSIGFINYNRLNYKS